MISRSLLGKVDESVRRTIEELSAQVDSLRSELKAVKASSNGNAKLSAAQVQQVAGLIGALSQPLIGSAVTDPVLTPVGTGSGTVTNFSAGDLTPLFTTTEATPTTTPALSFAQIVKAKNLVFAGPASGANANPDFRALAAADLPAGGYTAWTGTANRGSHATYSGTASVGYVQAELQGVMDSLLQVTQAVKALIDDLAHS